MRPSRSPEYVSWKAMCSRCLNPKDPAYDRYAGRGITICARWRCFPNFLADMGPRPSKHSLERKNNDGNYEPSNCVWATSKEQNNNRRSSRFVEFNGQRRTLIQWAEHLGLNYAVLKERLYNGWSISEALDTKTRAHHRLPVYEYRGEQHTLAEWAVIVGIPYTVLKGRIYLAHWSPEKAFNTPVRAKRRST